MARILRGVGRGWLAAGCVVALAALGATDSFAQSTATIAAYQYPFGQQQTLSSDGTAYINPLDYYNDPMPEVAFYVTNASSFSCTQVEWSITVNYTDPSGHGYGTYYSNNWYSSSCGATFTINPGDWGDDVGGTATMTATLYCNSSEVATGSFQFYILGSIQSETQVDTVKSEFGMPWFTGSIITHESCGGDDQFAPTPDFCQNAKDSAGYPLFNGTNGSDGIGLMQPDRTQNPQYFINATYWSYTTNMATANDVLNEDETESQNSWTSQYGDSGNVDPTSQDTKNPYPDCTFVMNTQALSSSNHSFGAADWIQDYNSHSDQHWYLWWDPSQGKWIFKYQTTEPGYDYVPQVCDSAPY